MMQVLSLPDARDSMSLPYRRPSPGTTSRPGRRNACAACASACCWTPVAACPWKPEVRAAVEHAAARLLEAGGATVDADAAVS